LEGTRLLIAPRHPERFNEVANLIAKSGFSFVRRSQPEVITSQTQVALSLDPLSSTPEDPQNAVVILLDTIGELASIYRFAAVVFVGGSLVPRGGHNIIEPAAFAKPIIVGPHTENFRQIITDFICNDAVVQLTKNDDLAGSLAAEIIRLLQDRDKARAMGERARAMLLRNRGATECTVAAIKTISRIRGTGSPFGQDAG